MGCSGKIEICNPVGHSRHRKCIENLIIGLFGAICIIMLVPIGVSAQVPRYSVDSVELYVYRDGLVHVAQILTVNETFPDIKIKLMTPEIENTIVVNEDEAVLDYKIDGTSMIIFTLGTKRALVEYDTVVMTQLEAGMWTLILNSPYNLTTYFPEGATIIYLDKVPNLIDVEENRTILHLSPGTWEISYLLSVTPTPTP
ncbi:MAG: hypothetical protein GTN80_10620, partial [Nitrososphaeria archaeon]|nr:hypothetical protein [Nitrososphaeria archaeon]NIQ34072.1 hypothetical protein [Nitrososphaeria archaeon]